MIERLRVTLLADNYAAGVDMLAEHGLSVLIEADGRRVLFDTGQGKVLRENLARLKLSLDPLDALVLSHGHYDHTQGIATVLEMVTPRAIFLHPAAAEPKFLKARTPPGPSIGMPEASFAALERLRERTVWTRGMTEVIPGMWATGEIPRTHAQPTGEPIFFLDDGGLIPDPLVDDQALVIETARGLVVLAGCTHAGVVPTIEHVCRMTGRSEIHAFAGGMHLGKASDRELEEAGDAFHRVRCAVLAPCHCTGLNAYAYLRGRFGARVREAGVGTAMEFSAAS